VPAGFASKMTDTCESIIDLITDPAFKKNTDRAVPPHLTVQHENDHPHFMVFDFGICENEAGETEPQLVEMQGFPSLFAFQVWHADLMHKHYGIPAEFTPYLNGYTRESYLDLFIEMLTADINPEQV